MPHEWPLVEAPDVSPRHDGDRITSADHVDGDSIHLIVGSHGRPHTWSSLGVESCVNRFGVDWHLDLLGVGDFYRVFVYGFHISFQILRSFLLVCSAEIQRDGT